MNTADLAISPLIIMSVTAVIAMLAIAIRRNHLADRGDSALARRWQLHSRACCLRASAVPRHSRSSVLILDSYSLIYMALLLCAAAFVIIFSYDYLQRATSIAKNSISSSSSRPQALWCSSSAATLSRSFLDSSC